PEFSFRDRFRLPRRTAVRLTRRSGGGFRLERARGGPIEGAPEGPGLSVRGGERTWSVRLRREEGRSPSWAEIDDGSGNGATVVTWQADDPGAPSSVLLADGRLFRIALGEIDPPKLAVGRWDLSGAYLEATVEDGAWRLETTAAGNGLLSLDEIVIATCFEIGRRGGWL